MNSASPSRSRHDQALRGLIAGLTVVLLGSLEVIEPMPAAAMQDGPRAMPSISTAIAANSRAKRAKHAPGGFATEFVGAVGGHDLSESASGGHFFEATFSGSAHRNLAPSSVGPSAGRPGHRRSDRVLVFEQHTEWTPALRRAATATDALTVVIEASADDPGQYAGADGNGVWLGRVMLRATKRDTFTEVEGLQPMFPRSMTSEDVVDWIAGAARLAQPEDAAQGPLRLRAKLPGSKRYLEAIAATVSQGETRAIRSARPVYEPSTVAPIVARQLLADVHDFRAASGGPHIRAAQLRTRSRQNALGLLMEGAVATTSENDLRPLALPRYVGDGAAPGVKLARNGARPRPDTDKAIWMQRVSIAANGVEGWRGYQRDGNGYWHEPADARVEHSFPQSWSKRKMFDAINTVNRDPSIQRTGDDGTTTRWGFISGVWIELTLADGLIWAVSLVNPSEYEHLKRPALWSPDGSTTPPAD